MLAAIRPIPEWGWVLEAKVDQDEVYAPIRRQAHFSLLLVGLLALALCLVTRIIWQQRELSFSQQKWEIERERLESHKKFRVLFEQAAVGVALFESRTRQCLEANQCFCDITGYTLEELQRLPFLEIVHPDDRQPDEENMKLLLTGQVRDFSAEKRYCRKDGAVIWVSLTVSPLWAAGEEPGQHAAVVFDITKRKQAEAQRGRLTRELEQKNEELNSLIYAASHDLRSPLVNVEGFSRRLEAACTALSQLANHPALPPAERQQSTVITREQIPKALGHIRNGVLKMNSLIDGLLRLSRLGHVAVRMETLDMNRLLQQVCTSLTYQFQRSGATQEIEVLPPCQGDAGLINQVFTNLVDNAIKYRDPDRPLTIRVSAHLTDEQVVYCVSDTGIGIAPEHQDKIWELFHRLHPSATTQGEGVGLNLVRRIVDRHQGRVWVESTVGLGSRFFIAFPRPQAFQQPQSRPLT